jgi:hypothetical protein
MKLNLHTSALNIYIPMGEYDGFRKFYIFEDFDETFLNFNFNSKKKILNYFSETETISSNLLPNSRKHKNFNSEYFNDI